MAVKKWLRALGDLCFPPRCLCCATSLAWGGDLELCPGCAEKLRFISPPLCPLCGAMYVNSGGGSHLCSLCSRQKYAFDRARSICRYNSEIGKIIHSLKFGGLKTGLRTMAALAENSLIHDLSTPDIIVPVPLHPTKLRSRGFNQSLLLAQLFFPDQKDKIAHALVRSRHTVAQTGLTGAERRKNVVGAFRVRQPQDVQDKKICLVDDVFTTGTTVHECARTLKKAGAASVEVATLAMVDIW